MPLLVDGIPDTSWLNGKYQWKDGANKIDAEIDTRLPYVAIGDYFVQGEEAEPIIAEIHKIWVKDGRRTTKTAIMHWAALYL